jgi:hypothetical protein
MSNVTVYKVVSTGERFLGLSVGFVRKYPQGWRFLPNTQQRPSRKFWPTPEDALKGRITNYKLEPHK